MALCDPAAVLKKMIKEAGVRFGTCRQIFNCLCWVLVMGLVGCAGVSTEKALTNVSNPPPQGSATQRHQKTLDDHEDGRIFEPSGSVATVANKPSAPAKGNEKTAPPPDDGFYDPFAKAEGDALDEEYDPWEGFNTKVFEFNRQLDKYVLKPVAQGYNFVVPNVAQIGVKNVFYNIRFPARFLNNAFQGKVRGAGIEVGRFLLNSSVGLGGLVDVATMMDIVTPEEDTGQTMGVYGIGPGPYLILPFLPPFTVRDFAGYVADIALNPINWLVFPIIEVNGIPSLVAHKNRMTTTIVQTSSRVGEIINDRSLNLEKFQGVEEATLDLYSAVRNAYLQKRAKAIRE
jgi:phospholipid-binding lipoprotein MlaA